MSKTITDLSVVWVTSKSVEMTLHLMFRQAGFGWRNNPFHLVPACPPGGATPALLLRHEPARPPWRPAPLRIIIINLFLFFLEKQDWRAVTSFTRGNRAASVRRLISPSCPVSDVSFAFFFFFLTECKNEFQKVPGYQTCYVEGCYCVLTLSIKTAARAPMRWPRSSAASGSPFL